MTRIDQKREEEAIARKLLMAENLAPEQFDCTGERPDILLTIAGRCIGLELTTYKSDQTQRASEARWDRLRNKMQHDAEQGSFGNLWINFCFGHKSLPIHSELEEFLSDLKKLLGKHPPSSSAEDDEHWDFAAYPNLDRHLCSLQIRELNAPLKFCVSSDVQAGYVAHPDQNLSEIVAKKARIVYRDKLAELWLAIYSGSTVTTQIAELPIPDTEDEWSKTGAAFSQSKFDRLYIVDHASIAKLDVSNRWTRLSAVGQQDQ